MTVGRGGALLGLSLALVACGPDSERTSGGSSAGTGGTSAGGGSGGTGATGGGPEGPWPCSAEIDFEPPVVPVRGTVAGDALQGTVCHGGHVAYAQDFDDPNSSDVLTAVALVGTPNVTRFEFETPVGTGEAGLDGVLAIGSGNPGPGTFTNDDGCGRLLLCADTPPASSTGDDTIACYGATAESNCTSLGFVVGSWSLMLTSITPFSGTVGVDARYVVHGSLTGVLANSISSTPDTIDVDLEF